MLSPTFFLPTPSLSATLLRCENTRLSTTVRSTQACSPCPSCGTPSSRVHSRYTRAPADLPVAGRPVTLSVEARRFYCERAECSRRTFSEPFPGFLVRAQRRTQRLEQAVGALGLALGGEAGARLARRLAIHVSPDTVLRTLRRYDLRPTPPPRVIGMDDWAFRRGHRYGTLLVDLERHRPIDLLPDRTAETLAAWLTRYPGIELISRDRAGAYADGARAGAPQARQVADRWHLLKNLREAVERVLSRYHRELQEAADAVAAVPTTPTTAAAAAPAEPPPGPRPTPQTRAERRRADRCARRLARYQAVLELHRQGQSLRAIAQHLDLQRVTVRRFLRAGRFPERVARASGPSRVDRFRPYLQQRWNDGCHNARQLFREITEQGFTGSESIVQRALRAWRPAVDHLTAAPVLPSRRAVSPRQASVWLLELATPHDRVEHQRQQAVVAHLSERVPAVEAARTLGRAFIRLLRQRQATKLPRWLVQAEQSNLPEFSGFARSLQSDYEAVREACRLPWSQGQVEGQVNRLKLIKRSMYGRAGFDLLRLRVLVAA